MQKKIITVLVSLVLLLSLATQAFAYGAWDEVEDNVYKLNFEGAMQTNSGRFTSTDMAVFSGYQALVYKPYSGSLQGGRDIAFQYFDEDETRILPAGEYEVSMWIYDTADMLNSEPDGDAFLVMTFFTPDQTELLFDVYGNENGQYYNTEKCAYYYDLIDFTEGEVYATKGETVENDTGIWTKYTFDITTPVDCDKASFYLLQPTPCTTHADQLFIIDEVVLVAKGAETKASTQAPATDAPATETETEAVTEAVTETEPATEAVTETEPATEAATEAATETEPETEPVTETEPATEAETETEAAVETEPATETEAPTKGDDGKSFPTAVVVGIAAGLAAVVVIILSIKKKK